MIYPLIKLGYLNINIINKIYKINKGLIKLKFFIYYYKYK
jgi:hypothetical protein